MDSKIDLKTILDLHRKWLFGEAGGSGADAWDEDRWNTCGHGIHFYITRLEAEAHT